MSGSAIPVVRTGNALQDRAHSAVKTRLDIMGGQLKNFPPLADLPATASLAEVIERVNEITRRMQR